MVLYRRACARARWLADPLPTPAFDNAIPPCPGPSPRPHPSFHNTLLPSRFPPPILNPLSILFSFRLSSPPPPPPPLLQCSPPRRSSAAISYSLRRPQTLAQGESAIPGSNLEKEASDHRAPSQAEPTSPEVCTPKSHLAPATRASRPPHIFNRACVAQEEFDTVYNWVLVQYRKAIYLI